MFDLSLLAMNSNDAAAAAGGLIAMLLSCFFMILWLALIVLVIAGMWKVFTKAGKPGWAAIVPIYNTIILIEIAGRPIWWILLCFIPLVNLAVFIIICMDVAKHFGKSPAYGVGLALLSPIFIPMLGFGSAQYNPQV